MRDLGDYEALGRKTNSEEMRLATEVPNPVSDAAVPRAAAAEGHRACPGESARFSDQPRMSELPPSLLP